MYVCVHTCAHAYLADGEGMHTLVELRGEQTEIHHNEKSGLYARNQCHHLFSVMVLSTSYGAKIQKFTSLFVSIGADVIQSSSKEST